MAVSAASDVEPESVVGRFIVFEGGDGSGKSTQARLLAEHLGAVLTREPGGTAVGAKIRELVLTPDHPEMADETEALLMAADRAQHVHERIRPALRSGRHVVSDRHVASSLAYQGVGRSLGVDNIAGLNAFAVGDVTPDLVILLEADPAAARRRLGDDLDRIEESGSDLAQVVAETYRRFADADPDRWCTIDATGSIDDVFARVLRAVGDRLTL